MTTNRHPHSDSHTLLLLVSAVAALLVGLTATLLVVVRTAPVAVPPPDVETAADDGDEGSGPLEFDGNAGRVPDSTKPKLTAYFDRESFRPGDTATLTILDHARSIRVQFYRTGGEDVATIPNDVMLGTPVDSPRSIGDVAGRRAVRLHIGSWPSGVYFAQLTSGDRVGYAPFVLAPRHLGEHPIAVVMPTMTWQAYNWRDDNGDGTADTWYAGWRTNHARLIRPFLDRGVPPHWKQYDAPFVRWLAHTGRAVDFLSDAELRNARSGDELAKAYTLLVFSGHHEYVTAHEYGVVRRYRDLGGNLAFLAANNFFWKVTLHDNVMTRVAQWRDLGLPESALIGVQYRANDDGRHRAGWLVKNEQAAPWLFEGTDVRDGQRIGSAGIEIDRTSPASPKNVRVIAEIPNLYGPGFTAQMTYYETPEGAKVFAAGAFTLAGSVWDPGISQIVSNMWTRLSAR